MIGTSRCQKFPFWDFSLCRSKKYSHEPRSSEKTKGTNEAKDYRRFPIVVPKSDSGEPNIVSRQCLYQRPEEPRNQRAAKKLRLCNAQRSSQVFPYKKSAFGNDTFYIRAVYVFINSVTRFRIFYTDSFFAIFF